MLKSKYLCMVYVEDHFTTNNMCLVEVQQYVKGGSFQHSISTNCTIKDSPCTCQPTGPLLIKNPTIDNLVHPPKVVLHWSIDNTNA
jgi:hypothetical protein